MRRDIRLGVVGTSALFMLVALGTLNNTTGATKPVGFLAIAAVLGLGSLLLLAYLGISESISFSIANIALWGGAFLLVYGVGLSQSFDAQALTVFGQVALSMTFFVAASLLSWRKRELQVLSLLSVGFIVLNALWWGVAGRPDEFSSYMANPNALGPLVYLLVFFVLCDWQNSSKKRFSLAAVLPLATVSIAVMLIYLSRTRSVWLAAIAGLLTYVGWRTISKSKFRFHAYLGTVFFAIAAVLFVYPQLRYRSWALYLNRFVYQKTGKNLLSGREDFWGFLIEVVGERLWLGHGAGTLPRQFTNSDLSAHNFYLQTALQVGLLGLAVFLGLLWCIWIIFWRGKESSTARLFGAFFVSILVHQTFEVGLTQNNLSLGIIQWLVIAIGVSKTMEYVRNDQRRANIDRSV